MFFVFEEVIYINDRDKVYILNGMITHFKIYTENVYGR